MEWIIEIDKHENTPLPFPDHIFILDPTALPWDRKKRTDSILTVDAHLPTADYRVKSHPTAVLIERKKDILELATNCLSRDGRRKFAGECRRLKCECRWPVLLIEGSIGTLLARARRYLDYDPWLVVDAFQRLCLENGVRILWEPGSSPPQRRLVGEQAAHLLVNGAITYGTS